MQNIQEYIDKAINTVTSFFEISPTETPKFVFVNSRKEMNECCGKETKNWVVAHSSNGKIYIFTPESFERESSHKFTEEKYQKLITHEVCHYYQERLTGTYKPVWFGEGLAIYLSDQYKDMNSPEKFKYFLNFHSRGGKEVYGESGFIIKLLIDKFGKDKLVEYINSFKEDSSEEHVKEKFEEIFDTKLSYESINSLL